MTGKATIPAFTLIELLISLVIAAITISLSHDLLQNSLSTEKKLQLSMMPRLEAEYMLSMVQADVAEAISLPSEGKKAVDHIILKDGTHVLKIKRLAWSTITKQLEGVTVKWQFSEEQIIKTISSSSLDNQRIYAIPQAKWQFDWINNSIMRIEIEHPKFLKTKIISLNAT